jgi:DNA-directed RNA polymerase subunit RPC12/RpoP
VLEGSKTQRCVVMRKVRIKDVLPSQWKGDHIRTLSKKCSEESCDVCFFLGFVAVRITRSVDKCDKMVTRILGSHDKMKSYGNIACRLCGKEFKTKRGLEMHTDARHSDKEVKCNVCHKKFSALSNLRKHVKVVHEAVRQFVCGDCGRQFKNKAVLRNHIIAIHLNEKPYACVECDSKFSRKSSLESHQLTVHLNIRRYQCSHCVASFSSTRGRYLHMRTAHKGDGSSQ